MVNIFQQTDPVSASAVTTQKFACEQGCEGNNKWFGRKADRDRHYRFQHSIDKYVCLYAGCTNFLHNRADKLKEHMEKKHCGPAV